MQNSEQNHADCIVHLLLLIGIWVSQGAHYRKNISLVNNHYTISTSPTKSMIEDNTTTLDIFLKSIGESANEILQIIFGKR